jgi:hypothetical protein
MAQISAILLMFWRAWQKAIHSINEVVAFVLMSVAYVLAVMPVSFFFRLFAPDALDRGLGDPHASTYWKSVVQKENANDIRRVQRQY